MIMSVHLNIPQFENFKELIDSCVSFYENNQEKIKDKSVNEKRNKLSMSIEKFHIESGTLTSKVKEKIVALRQGAPVLLMTAHQPNLLPYSGVLRKATLNFLLGKELERRLDVQVVNFFGIADQDFTDDRWVKASLLPAITRKDGILTLNINLPNKIILKNVHNPSINTINKWKDEIETWLHNALYMINNIYKENGILNWDSKKSLLHHNFDMFWEIVEEAHERAISYSDFNAFIISKIVNEAWRYDTLFSRFSDCQKIFINEFNSLLTDFRDYSSSLKETIDFLHKKDGKKGVSKEETELLPFWYHCDCGSKARLSLNNKNERLIGHGYCINCKKEYNINLGKKDKPDVYNIATKISARAIPMILIFSKGLGLTCYIGGVGGIRYLEEAKYVANKLDITLPPVVVWRPFDKYMGIGQLEAIIEYKRITGHYDINKFEEEIDHMKHRIDKIYKNITILEEKKKEIILELKKDHIDKKIFRNNLKSIIDRIGHIKKTTELSILNRDLKILENFKNVSNLMPSIIDYAINIGLNETSKQWIDFLVNNGSFSSEVLLNSFLNDLRVPKKSL